MVLIGLAGVIAPISGLRAQSADRDHGLPDNTLIGPPAPAISGTGSALPAVGEALAGVVSPETLRKADAAASQRLRFDAGDRVFFSAGSADLGSRARVVLSRQAHWIASWQASVVIVGHADEGGAMDNDERVALQRAEAVRIRLSEEGIPLERIQVLGMGGREPIADCPEPECAVQNRRAVIHVMSIKTDGGQR